MSVKGDAFSLQPNNFEMRMRLCVRRCCICFPDDIVIFGGECVFLEFKDNF